MQSIFEFESDLNTHNWDVTSRGYKPFQLRESISNCTSIVTVIASSANRVIQVFIDWKERSKD